MTSIDWHGRAKQAQLNIRNFIDGGYQEIGGDERITKHFAGDGRFLYEFGRGTTKEVNRAVAVAHTAFKDGRWSKLPVYQRKAVLQKLAQLIEEHKEIFALYECLDVGKPITNALGDVATAAACLRGYAENADKLLSPAGANANGANFAYQLRKPIGVVGGIIGWNFPLVLAAQKVGPALAMGNSLVLKPSEFTSLSAGLLAELAMEAGVPSGVFNLVHGAGATVGTTLAQHPDVGMLTFVGSSATGKQIMIAAGQSNMKRVQLECGGKSPFLVFDDCPEDLDFIAHDIVADTAFVNQGALCVSSSRLLLQESIKDKLIPKIIEQAGKLQPKNPLDADTTFGAIMNQAHMHKVLGYIESGKQEGAELVYGGNQVNRESGGYYIEPTIFNQVNPNQKIAQEEIFGPVLSIFTFKDEEEGIQLANDTSYGLAAYATTQNLGRVQRLAHGINAGSLTILGTSTLSAGGVGGISFEPQKESGIGADFGMEGMKSYTVATTVNTWT
ncbi:MAG: aldehyde dehydrogenase family protein [Exilibacterium sp.]